jgi:excinuclease ABC subunit C
VSGQDDFAMMREVITRRFRRYLDEQTKPVSERKFAYPPNLVIIDGGKGQLNAARAALDELGIAGVEICGLAKRLEEVFLPDHPEPVLLPRASEALYLLQRVRDEAHRFAVTYHRTLRGKRMVESAFDEIPGIGPSRRRSLLDTFGSLQGVRDATLEQLGRAPGISETLARAIYGHFHADTPDRTSGRATKGVHQ